MREKLPSRTLLIGLTWGLVNGLLFIAIMFVSDLSSLRVYAALLLGSSLLAGFFLTDLGRLARALQLSQVIALTLSLTVLSLTPSQVQLVFMGLFSTDLQRSSETGRLLFFYFGVVAYSILAAIFGSIPGLFVGEWVRGRRNARKLRPLDPLPSKE